MGVSTYVTLFYGVRLTPRTVILETKTKYDTDTGKPYKVEVEGRVYVVGDVQISDISEIYPEVPDVDQYMLESASERRYIGITMHSMEPKYDYEDVDLAQYIGANLDKYREDFVNLITGYPQEQRDVLLSNARFMLVTTYW